MLHFWPHLGRSFEMGKLVENVLVIGVGLIGGSLAKALRQRGLTGSVAGYGRSRDQLLLGVERGIIDLAVDNLDSAIAMADLIVLGVPTLTVKSYLPIIEKHRKASAVVTDVASVKGEIVRVVTDHFGMLPEWFVPGHPIAGSETSGIAASNADLYIDHKVILTPDANTNPESLSLVADIWKAVGAEVVLMSVAEHDKVLAATSHLPHALAYTLVDTLASLDVGVDVFRFAAGGFRDFTRIASSHPVMWHDIMLANREAIIDVMASFRSNLDRLEQAMVEEDSETIMAIFERAKTSRDHFAELLKNPKKEDLS